jgi:hypothetical protein
MTHALKENLKFIVALPAVAILYVICMLGVLIAMLCGVKPERH